MISFPSARTLLAGLAVALCALTSLGNSAAADPTSSNYSYSGPSYGAAFNPPVIPTFNLNFTPLKAPAFRAPSYQGPVGYRGPARKAPTVNKTVTKQVVIHRGGREAVVTVVVTVVAALGLFTCPDQKSWKKRLLW